MQHKAIEMRAQAVQLRRTAEEARTPSDRAFFRRQAKRLDHQAEELERRASEKAGSSRHAHYLKSPHMEVLRGRLGHNLVASSLVRMSLPLTAEAYIELHTDDGGHANLDGSDLSFIELLRELEQLGWDGKCGLV
jgi:hypothetical protein